LNVGSVVPTRGLIEQSEKKGLGAKISLVENQRVNHRGEATNQLVSPTEVEERRRKPGEGGKFSEATQCRVGPTERHHMEVVAGRSDPRKGKRCGVLAHPE
jgi:hypothetical protein